jgi:UDP-N-acetylmuramoyl-tripeptide--D-alanyl-D-alanine ligase
MRSRLRAKRDIALKRKAARGRARSKATFIGISGSSAKSTTAALLVHILVAHGGVRQQVKFNDLRAIMKTLVGSTASHDFVVVEAGVESGDEMKPMAEALQPDVAIMTMVAIEHKSAFHTHEKVAAEKGELIAALRPGGFAMLNGDDPHVMAMANRTRERIVVFGRSENCDYRATGVSAAFPRRLSLTVLGANEPLRLQTNFVGEHFWLPTLAAVATATELGVPSDVIADRVATFEPLAERCGVIRAPGSPDFILDTTKAPWHSIKLAFAVLAKATPTRKRIVLGHMSDFIGSNTKYRDAYRWAREVADEVIFVGDHSHRSKASQEDCDSGRFHSFSTTDEVANHIRNTFVPGEVILLKGSVDLHLERIALSWTHDVKCWVRSCGRSSGCLDCGRYEYPYERHKGRKKPGRLVRRLKKIGLN